MSRNKSEVRSELKKLLRTVCDNVTDYFTYPEERASLQSGFPYITFIFGEAEFDGSSTRFMQNVSIIGFVKGKENDIMELQDDFEKKVFNALYKKNDIGLIIESCNNTNLFKPFGIDMGLFPPYGGFRFECKIAQVTHKY